MDLHFSFNYNGRWGDWIRYDNTDSLDLTDNELNYQRRQPESEDVVLSSDGEKK